MQSPVVQLRRQCLATIVLYWLFGGLTSAQDATTAIAEPTTQTKQADTDQAPAASSSDNSGSGDPVTLFPHSDTARYWIFGQANIIFQWHGDFPAAYSGTNSLRNHAENAASRWFTLYLGYQLTPTTEVFLDPESASGDGISNGLGLAGFTNLDVVRITNGVSLGAKPYIARVMLRQIIPLSSERVEAERDPLHLAMSLPARRIEFRIGKFSLADFFDTNTWGTDSHLQFLSSSAASAGATVTTNLSLTPKTIEPSKSAASLRAAPGIAATIALESPSSPTVSSPRISSISPSAAWVFSWVTAPLPTDLKRS